MAEVDAPATHGPRIALGKGSPTKANTGIRYREGQAHTKGVGQEPVSWNSAAQLVYTQKEDLRGVVVCRVSALCRAL